MRTVLARHALHVLVTFAVTLAGMLYATRQPITTQLVVSTLPAAAVATLRALEARTSKRSQGTEGTGAAQSG